MTLIEVLTSVPTMTAKQKPLPSKLVPCRLLPDGIYKVPAPGQPQVYYDDQTIAAAGALLGLSLREATILCMISDAFSDAQIAFAFRACLPGTRRVVRQILRKVGVDRRVQAAVRWQRALDVAMAGPQGN